MNVTIKKIAIDKGVFSMVSVGSSCTGKLEMSYVNKPKKSGDPRIKDIRIGKQILVGNLTNYIKTSPVTEILNKTDNEIVFKTTTSTYEIKMVEE